MSAPKRDIQWADGIRGIACLVVIIAHTFEAFYWPWDAFDRPFYILQLPFFRLLVQGGYLSVGIFFVMSGYVCAIKPVRLAREGKVEECRRVIASSAIRRILRLAGPTFFATFVSWLLDRFGAFNVARSLPGRCWLNLFSPPRFDSFFDSVRELVVSAIRTYHYLGFIAPWFINRFEGVQWTMVYEIRGSMFVFMTLIVVCPFTPFYRRAALVFLTAWAIHFDENVLLTIPFLLGTLLAELSYVAKPTEHWWPIVLAIVALFFASYPPDNPEKAAWSQFLRSSAEAIIPNEHDQYHWAFAWFSATILIIAIQFGIKLQKLLSHRYVVFLGSISFPLYLLHSMMMRSVLATIIYGIIPASGGLATRPMTEGEEPVPMSLFWTAVTAFVYPSWLAFVLFLSVQWRDRLDGKFVALSQYVEALLLGKKSFTPVSFFRQKGGQNGDLEMAPKQEVK